MFLLNAILAVKLSYKDDTGSLITISKSFWQRVRGEEGVWGGGGGGVLRRVGSGRYWGRPGERTPAAAASLGHQNL